VLQKSLVRALDYDARLCPARALGEVRRLLDEAVDGVLNVIIGSVDDAARQQVGLPGPLGGMALRELTEISSHAAYWAAWAAHRDDVASVATRLGRPHRRHVDADEAATAAEALEQHGVHVDLEGGMGLTVAAIAEYNRGPWAHDTAVADLMAFGGGVAGDEEDEVREQCLAVDGRHDEKHDDERHGGKHDGRHDERHDEGHDEKSDGRHDVHGPRLAPAQLPWPVERGKRRRVLGRIMKGVDAMSATRLWERLPKQRREAMLSAGGPGAGGLWSTVPVRPPLQFTSAQWTMAAQRRLGACRKPCGAQTCQLPAAGSGGGGGSGDVCGAVLDGALIHAALCGAGPMRMRGHRAIASTLRAAVEREGAIVDLERTLPELYSTDASGAVTEAVMDMVIYWPGAGTAHWVDVSIRCAHASRYTTAQKRGGVAAAAGEVEKRRRYGDSVSPLIFETAGRLGRCGIAALAAMDRDARMYGRRKLGRLPGLNVRSVRVLLEAAIIRHDADATLLSLGAFGRIALGWS
jgi:hypothetical protein